MKEYKYNAVVSRIIDGDTIYVDINLGFNIIFRKQQIRLYGIDTPESRTRNLEEKIKGIEATNFLKDRIKVGDDIIISTLKYNHKGKFGRFLAEIYYFDSENNLMNLNIELLESGNAVPYFGGQK